MAVSLPDVAYDNYALDKYIILIVLDGKRMMFRSYFLKIAIKPEIELILD